MKRYLFLTLMLLLTCLASQPDSPAAAADLAAPPQSGAVLCLPGIYPQDPQDCLPLGPSEVRTHNAQQGILLPLTPLPQEGLTDHWCTCLSIMPCLKKMRPRRFTIRWRTLKPGKTRSIPLLQEGCALSLIMKASTPMITANQLLPPVLRRLGAGGVGRHAHLGSARVPGPDLPAHPAQFLRLDHPPQPTAQTKRTPGKEIGDYTGMC